MYFRQTSLIRITNYSIVFFVLMYLFWHPMVARCAEQKPVKDQEEDTPELTLSSQHDEIQAIAIIDKEAAILYGKKIQEKENRKLIDKIIDKACRCIETRRGGIASSRIGILALDDLLTIESLYPIGSSRRDTELQRLLTRTRSSYQTVKKLSILKESLDDQRRLIQDLGLRPVHTHLLNLINDWQNFRGWETSGGLVLGLGLGIGGEFGLLTGERRSFLGKRSWIVSPCWGNLYGLGPKLGVLGSHSIASKAGNHKFESLGLTLGLGFGVGATIVPKLPSVWTTKEGGGGFFQATIGGFQFPLCDKPDATWMKTFVVCDTGRDYKLIRALLELP